METFLGRFKASAKEFENLRSLVLAALLIALHTVFACVLSIQVTESVRISVSFLVNVAAGCLLGPVMGFVCGGIGDLVQFFVRPTGPFFPGWTFNAALAGLIYGTFFYKKFPKTDFQQQQRPEKLSVILRAVTCGIPPIAAAVLLFAPYVRVTAKEDNVLLFGGTGARLLMGGLFEPEYRNVVIVLCMLLLMLLVVFVAELWQLKVIPVVLSVFCGFAALLAIYTDQRTTSPRWGFMLVMALLAIYIAAKLARLFLQQQMDMSFLIRTALAITLDTLLVNVLLGTIWVCVMYGKGFFIYFTGRLVKNMIQLPINIMLTYYVLGFVKKITGGLMR